MVMLRAAAVKDKGDTRLCQQAEFGRIKESTFEVVEEILFRVCEIRVWKRVCERVEVEGGIHVGRWWSGSKKRSVASLNVIPSHNTAKITTCGTQ